MEDLSLYVGVIGNIISVLVFLSPIGTFRRIVQNRLAEEFQSLQYICSLLNSSLWTYYGITRPGAYLVATVNSFGILVEFVYVALFLVYAPTRATRTKLVKTVALFGILNVGFLTIAIVVTQSMFNGQTRIDAIGFLCAALNIVMYASPLSAMKAVVITMSVEFMPFMQSFLLFINGAIWTLYALLVRDYFLGVPNGIGFLLGVAQLVLYAIYRKAKPKKTFRTNLTCRNIESESDDGFYPFLIPSYGPNELEEDTHDQPLIISSSPS